MKKNITHILKLEIYLTENKYVSENDLRNYYMGYLKAKVPELDIENIIVKKI